MFKISRLKTIRSFKLLTLQGLAQNWTEKPFMANDNMIFTNYI